MNEVKNFIIENWLLISPVLLVVLLRLWPTEKNVDIIKLFVKFLDQVIPNLKKGGGKHTLILLLISSSAFAQLNTNTRQIRFNTVQYTTDTAQVVSNSGRMWYDHSTDEFRGNKNGVNFTFGGGSGSGGSLVSAKNGLSVVNDSVILGGSLDRNTSIDGTNFQLDFTADLLNITGQTDISLFTPSLNISNSTDWEIRSDNTTTTINNTTGDISIQSGTSSINMINSDFIEISGANDVSISAPSAALTVGQSQVELSNQSGNLVNITSFGSGSARVTLGTGSGVPITSSLSLTPSLLDITGVPLELATLAANPAGSNGRMIYNTALNKFQCYENGVWVNCVSTVTAPAGANTQVQFNNSGSFGASSSFTWNATSLNVGAIAPGSSGVQTNTNGSIVGLNGISLTNAGQITANANGYITEVTSGAGNGTGRGGDVRITTDYPTTDGWINIDTGTGQLTINDGANQTMGIATLAGGNVTVNNTKITANSRIFLTINAPSGTPGSVYVLSRVAGTSFTITSTSGGDNSSVAWLIVEPN